MASRKSSAKNQGFDLSLPELQAPLGLQKTLNVMNKIARVTASFATVSSFCTTSFILCHTDQPRSFCPITFYLDRRQKLAPSKHPRPFPVHKVHVLALLGRGTRVPAPGKELARGNGATHLTWLQSGQPWQVPSRGSCPARESPDGAEPAGIPRHRHTQASPCLVSLWPRRGGPRPRRSLGGCGS